MQLIENVDYLLLSICLKYNINFAPPLTVDELVANPWSLPVKLNPAPMGLSMNKTECSLVQAHSRTETRENFIVGIPFSEHTLG